MKNFARLKESSPFFVLFPNGCAPIQNILVPELGNMGDTGVHEFYRVDVKQLEPGQLLKICELVAQQCGGKKEQVCLHFEREGFIPLRSLHVASVACSSPAFL